MRISDTSLSRLEKSLKIWQERLSANPNDPYLQKMVKLREEQVEEAKRNAPKEESKPERSTSKPAEAKEPTVSGTSTKQLEKEANEITREIPKIKNASDLYAFAETLGVSTKTNGKPRATEAVKSDIAKALWDTEHPDEEMPPQISPMLIKDITAEGKEYVDSHFKSSDWWLECFKGNTEVLMGDNSIRKISDISIGDVVKAWDGTRIVSVPVLETYKSNKREHLVVINSPRGKTLCTPDHKVLTDKGWIRADMLHSAKFVNLDDVQLKMFLGTMLGDSTIDKLGAWKFDQCKAHDGYVRFLSKVLGLPITSITDGLAKCNGKSYAVVKLISKAKRLNDLENQFYIKKDKRIKVIPNIVYKNLSAPLFATWYLDDGTLSTGNTVNPNARLFFNQFSEDSMQPIFDFLKEEGFTFKVLSYDRRNNPLRIVSFDWKSTIKFCEWIAPYVPKSMSYKIVCPPKGDLLETKCSLGDVDVVVKKYNHAREFVYCIQTPLENFVLATGMVVHNCKINGQRFILVLEPDGTTHMTSRDRSVKHFRFSELDDHVLGLLNLKSPFKGRCIVDGEIFCDKAEIDLPSGVHTTSTLQSTVSLMHMNSKDSLQFQRDNGFSLRYKVFDILELDGKNVEKLPYEERKELLYGWYEEIMKLNPDASIDFIPAIKDYESAWDTFQDYVNQGGEGLILKNRKAPYEQGKRSKGQWKLKGRITIDAFITGWVPSDKTKGYADYIGGFVFSTNYKGKEIEIAAVSNIDLATRKAATVYDDKGEPTLNPEWYGKCAELVCQNLHEKTFRAGSARIEEWRDDKTPSDCELQEEMIRFDR